MATLNHLHRLFLNYYLKDAKGDAVKAARMAGYKNPERTGPVLLNNRQVAAYLEQKMEESGALTVAELLARLSTIATLDPMEFIVFDEDDKAKFDLKKVKKLKKGHLIKDLKIRRNGDVEVSFHSSVEAMDKLAKIQGLFKERLVIEDERGDADNDRVLAILGGLAQLARSINPGAGGGAQEPGALRGGGEQWTVEARPAPGTDQPIAALGRPEEDQEVVDHARPEAREVRDDLEVLPGLDAGEEAEPASDPGLV